MNKRVVRIILVIVILAAAVLAYVKLSGRGGGSVAALTTSGTIQATEIPIAAEVAGKVTEVLVEEGQRVKAGDMVLKMDTVAAQLQLEQAKAAHEMAQARLAEAKVGPRPDQIRQSDEMARQAEAAQAGAQKNYDTIKELYRQNAAPKTQLDAATTQFETATAQARAARAQASLVKKGATDEQLQQLTAAVEQARVAVDLAQFNLDRSQVKATIGGIVVRRLVEPGALIAPGASVAVLQNLDDLWIKVYVPEDQLNVVKMGDTVAVAVDAYPRRTFKAEVVNIAENAEFTPRNVQTKEERATTVYAVKLRLREGLNGELKPGMPTDVSFGATSSIER